jgi:hypothetical protein
MMSIWGGDIRYSVHFGEVKYLGEEKHLFRFNCIFVFNLNGNRSSR